MKNHRSIFKNDTSYLLTIDLPGVDKENIDISLKKQQLHITAKIDLPNDRQIFGKTLDSEHSFAYDLHRDIDTESITATHKDGVLSITLPRRTLTQQITIQ